ncbi:MAG: ABC transporter permease [Abitibacteriaceae bacterium]|nr:ABC transporter permease [Abditibacteriaceae bacterium]
MRFREIGILVFLVILAGATTVREPRFLSAKNLTDILLDIPLLMVVAMGMTMIILSRNIDLSVGSTLGLSAIIVGFIFKSNPNFPVWAGAIIGILVGLLLGALNGILVTWLRVPAIIATLGTLNVFRGLVFVVSGGQEVGANDIPPSLIELSRTSPIQLPWIVIFAVLVTIATHLFLRYTRTGREIYAIGSSPKAARLRGIQVEKVVFLAFTLTGGFAGLAGIMYASRYGFINPLTTGAGLELSVIAATIIGGTNILGGSGSVPGTVLGCLLLGVINNALVITNLSAFWQLAIYGVVILIAVAVDSLIRRQLERAAVDQTR